MVNDMCNEHAIKVGIIKTLTLIAGAEDENTTYNLSALFRSAVRCFAVALRSEEAII